MKREIISNKAPKPIGPYSQGIVSGNLFFTAGQIALDASTGVLNTSSITEETHTVMRNLKALLEEAGMNFTHVLKCSIFLSDMNNFAVINGVYASYFEAPYPVRETVEVSRLPKDANVEISLIASVG